MASIRQTTQNEEVAELLKTLAHPMRIQIIRCLGRYGRLNVTTIQRQVPATQGVLSNHLIKLADRHILERTRKGREIYYNLADPAIMRMLDALMPV